MNNNKHIKDDKSSNEVSKKSKNKSYEDIIEASTGYLTLLSNQNKRAILPCLNIYNPWCI